MKDNSRKCAKCNASTAEKPNLVLHRFPKPGASNLQRMVAWAEFCYPDENCSSIEFLKQLHTSHKMLCSKHFPQSAFVENNLQQMKLHRYAIPSEHSTTTQAEVPIGTNSAETSQTASSTFSCIEMTNAQQISQVDIPGIQLAETSNIHPVTDSLDVVFSARGLMPPVFTLLNDDLTINYTAISPYAKFLADNGIKSVLVGGTTGEHMSFSVADRKKIIDEWVAAGKRTGLHIMVQVAGAPLADVIALAQYSQQAGADSLLTLPELYFKPTSVQELVSYVAEVAKAAPKLPILYYHIPAWSKVEINMPAFVAAATAQIPNFKGIKFTSNDLSEGAQVLRTLKDGQEIFLGADTLLAPAALLGINSGIGTSFNLFPGLAAAILAAVEANDVAKARALQEKLCLAIEAITAEGPWVPTMKAGMEIVTGIKTGPPALPQRPVSSEARNRIQTKLKALGF